MYKEQLKEIGDFVYELPKTGEMNVPGRIFLSEDLLKSVEEDCLKQVSNVAKLQGIVGYSIGMSDIHVGYGFPIGGVAAFDSKKGVISPGGVGYDINCSVRLLKTNLRRKDFKGKEKEILHSLFRTIPTGVGCRSNIEISPKELDNVLINGTQWAVKKGYGFKKDYLHTEENGKFEGANPREVSQRAKGRGIHQLGTLGAGNHFFDVLIVDEIFDKKVAEVFGLKKGQVVMLIHCGSRGLGHQVASDYIKLINSKYGHLGLDRGLMGAPITSDLGKKYLAAMACAANFAFANKQLITHFVRENMKNYFPNFKAEVVYDICHNIAKFEKHFIDGNEKDLLVIRKGATRSFGPGRKEIPEDYRKVGQPIFIPGSMGTSSYVLCGTKKAEELSFGSTAHGSGRIKSRSQAKKDITFEEAKKEMEKRGVFVESGSKRGLVEEFPLSYKNVDEVVRVSHKTGIGCKVARMNPFMVVIG
tara:strand:+ start:402 stop:1820 length:1419 start_codon:yes stop_codon:yes gene_type:complete